MNFDKVNSFPKYINSYSYYVMYFLLNSSDIPSNADAILDE